MKKTLKSGILNFDRSLVKELFIKKFNQPKK